MNGLINDFKWFLKTKKPRYVGGYIFYIHNRLFSGYFIQYKI